MAIIIIKIIVTLISEASFYPHIIRLWLSVECSK